MKHQHLRSGTWRWAPLLVALAVVAAACGDDDAVTTTSAATTTTAAPTTTSGPQTGAKTPAGTVEELVTDLFTALNAMDDAALRALNVDGARHAVYYSQNSPDGSVMGGPYDDVAISDLTLAELGFDSVEVLGDPIVAGEAVAVPVAYVYPGETDVGFDLLTVTEVVGGYLFSGGVTFYAPTNMAPGVGGEAIIADYIAAWNGGAVPDVMGFFDSDGAMWESIRGADPDTMYQGDALPGFLAESLWFQVEATGPIVTSGPYLAVPNRLSAGTDESAGVSLFLLREGKILLHAYAQ